VLLNNNVKLTSRLNIVNRIYSQNIEDFLSRKFSLKKRNFIFSFRHLGFSSSLLNSYLVPKFPNFSQKDLLNSRKLVSKHAPNISVDKYIIGVNLRSKGYIQHNLLSQYMMNFRNASINDISESIKVLNTDRNIFVRFGHFDNETAYIKNFVDLRKQLLTNNELQLSLFASINAYFGTANGPVSFFVNQKKPCLLVSTYPIDFEYPTDPHAVIIIPKLVWDQFNKRYFSLEELFDLDFLKMQNLYNDHALIKNGLRIESPPSTLTAKIFAGWQDSILLQKNTNWLKLSVEASSNLRKKLNLPKLATIPIDYFDYVKSL
jgi:putative glycosyltransferase (TIGR04372 family)